jgi:hypothetical protein
MSNDHGTVTRIRKKPAAKLVLARESGRREGQDGEDGNEQEVGPGKPVAKEETEYLPHRSQIWRVTVATSPVSRFSAARTDFLTGSE